MFTQAVPLWAALLVGTLWQVPSACLWWTTRSMRNDMARALEELKETP